MQQSTPVPPGAESLSFSTPEDMALTADLSEQQQNRDIVSYRLVTAPANGAVTLDDDGLFMYTPVDDFNGNDRFTYGITSGDGSRSNAQVTIVVTPQPDAPLAQASAVTGDEDSAIAGRLSGSDADGDALVYAVGSDPSNGSVDVAADGSFIYQPAADFNGSDAFTFTVSDGSASSAPATVQITVDPVNDAPIAAAQSLVADEDTEASGQASATDVDDDTATLRYRTAQAASSGAVEITDTGALTYRPNTTLS